MTISATNTTSDACLICHRDYTSTEREDTTKVVELACHHFYHLDCLSPWFSMNENRGQELSCCYQCEPSSLPKRSQPSIIDSEVVEKRFAEIEQNQDFGSRSEVITCLAQLKPHSNTIANLLNNMVEAEGSEGSYERFKNWIIANVQEDSYSIAFSLSSAVLEDGKALRSLQQEIRHLATIPIAKWSTEINKEGVPVYYLDGSSEFRMRISKDYLERATYAYLYEDIHNRENFERNLTEIEELYNYDQEVLNCIQDARDLHKTISDKIKQNAALPIDKIILSIEELVGKTQLSENSKRTIPLVINEILFRRGALRTLNQETDRWKKERIETWPTKIKENGIYYLDKKNTVKHLNAENFMAWVKATHRAEKTLAIANEITASLIRNTVGFIATEFFNSLV